jgi:hypothetical protein
MKRIKFGKYAGVKIKGKIPMEVDSNRDGVITHAERAAWLTAHVESDGKYGCVMNYDGTGMTAGIHQAVAVYPRDLDSKGSLWSLLADICIKASNTPGSEVACRFCDLQDAFMGDGYEFCGQGYLRNRTFGKRATGVEIRNLFTGAFNGVMPESGPLRDRAEKYVKLFHELFSSRDTFSIQNEFGIRHFSMWAGRKLRFSKKYSKATIGDIIYRWIQYPDGQFLTVGDIVDLGIDLAMCMFWSHMVNAPGEGLKVFCRVVDEGPFDDLYGFAKVLVKRLGTSKYGRWDDDLKNGRYQRTRRYAIKSGFWPESLFEGLTAIMPKNLEG